MRVYLIVLVFVALVFSPLLTRAEGGRKADSLNAVILSHRQDSSRLKSMVNLILHYYNTGSFEKSIEQSHKAITLSEKLNNKIVKGEIQNLLSNNYWKKGDNKVAIDYGYKALKTFESIDYKLGIADSYNNIGLVEWNMNRLKEALEYYLKSKDFYYKASDINKTKKEAESGVAGVLNNIGIIYWLNGDLEEAIPMFEEAVRVNEKTGKLVWLSNNYNNIAGVYAAMGKYDLAIPIHLKNLDLRTRIGDREGMATTYINLGSDYFITGKPLLAKDYFNKALVIASEIGSVEDYMYVYEGLSQVDSMLGYHKESREHFRNFILFRDSLENIENDRMAMEKEIQHSYDKKEALLIVEQEKKELLASEEKKQHRLWLVLIAAIAIGLGIIVIIVYRSFKQSQKQKKLIESKKLEVEHQKEIVEEKNREILDSIEYAKRLQDAILPPLKLVKEYLTNSFILYKPKDIVAGDFYWMETVREVNKPNSEVVHEQLVNVPISQLANSSSPNQLINSSSNQLILFAAADCTGHGVPGAMVSVVCSNALNRAVKEFGLTEPSKILDKVTDLVIETFEKSEAEVKDGMDISLVSLAHRVENESGERKATLKWAGANNPLWIVRSSNTTSDSLVAEVLEAPEVRDFSTSPEMTTLGNSQYSILNTHYFLEEIKADKQPIGKYAERSPFTNHQMELVEGDTIYIFTDGYADQFGGEKGKKFKSSKLKELILSIQHLEMNEQKDKIYSAFEAWRGNLDQVDDVCIIGVRI